MKISNYNSSKYRIASFIEKRVMSWKTGIDKSDFNKIETIIILWKNSYNNCLLYSLAKRKENFIL